MFLRFYAKDIRFGFNVKTAVIRGVDVLADTVAVTMGPRGRNVILEQFGAPKITKDGVTVAKCIELKDRFQNIGIKLMQHVANTTNLEAGDGTSTATVLARAIAKSGFDQIRVGANPFEIRKGVQLAITTAKQELIKLSIPISTPSEIEQVATISANGDQSVGKLITTAIRKIGKDGVVVIKSGKTLNDDIKIIEGLEFDRGYISPHFIKSNKGCKVEFTNALVLLSQKKIFTAREILPSLEIAHKQKQPLVIITEDIDTEPLSVLIVNKIKIGLQVVVVKAPGFGNHMKKSLADIATVTGGIVFEDDTNLIRLENVLPQSLGNVDEVIITRKSTIMLRGHGDKDEIEQRLQEIASDLKSYK
ncbi:Heat shock protein 60A [Eumeta japonica]|uniref:Heat shock protein 60A n=1 Tax=Eumeta variegata TaxID=151549 RepID=A0A4C1SPW3_EUMVA|nr:Heat shock protein 60A [Eumeta japonica]